jgi:hypothetical protein
VQGFVRLLLTIGLMALFTACGGGTGSGGDNQRLAPSGPPPTPITPKGDNVQPITVNGGPVGTPNLAYTNVTVCIPGTTQCQVINNVIVDTGSTGLRVLASALGNLALPQQQLVAGHTLAECIPFVDGSYVWGPVTMADIKIAGKVAQSAHIQVIGQSGFGPPPAPCLNNSNPAATPLEINSAESLGGNAILGVGHFREDCGQYCLNIQNDYYYDCDTTAGCVETAADTTRQVQNPVALFAGDNNGVAILLPKVSDEGAASIDGWMIFGINTRDNNALGDAKIFTVDSIGNLTTIYQDSEQTGSFVDSGSNALYFFDNSIPQCQNIIPLFCPPSTLNSSATIIGQNQTSATIRFSVVNPNSLNSGFYAFNNLGAFYFGDFDWGLPFFFGRTVYTALETNPGGPYIAF